MYSYKEKIHIDYFIVFDELLHLNLHIRVPSKIGSTPMRIISGSDTRLPQIIVIICISCLIDRHIFKQKTQVLEIEVSSVLELGCILLIARFTSIGTSDQQIRQVGTGA
jgi:hypothetical protein